MWACTRVDRFCPRRLLRTELNWPVLHAMLIKGKTLAHEAIEWTRLDYILWKRLALWVSECYCLMSYPIQVMEDLRGSARFCQGPLLLRAAIAGGRYCQGPLLPTYFSPIWLLPDLILCSAITPPTHYSFCHYFPVCQYLVEKQIWNAFQGLAWQN